MSKRHHECVRNCLREESKKKKWGLIMGGKGAIKERGVRPLMATVLKNYHHLGALPFGVHAHLIFVTTICVKKLADVKSFN